MEKNKREILYFRESALQSIISDTFMYAGMLGLMYFNHKVLSGSGFVDGIFILIMLLSGMSRTSKRYHRFTNWQELKEFVNKEQK